ncbi:MAG: LUD domain-containing protein, partial [Bacteroidaceae bacterium]|nr:LUD domain-containing protein [Bacteroidaceae bacterium]
MEKKDFSLLQKKLQSLGYTVNCFETASEAAQYLNTQIHQQTVGFAGSMTLEKMGLYEQLRTHNQVHWHQRIPEGKTSQEVRLLANAAPIYITSVNGIAETGEIVNIDAN